MLNVPLLRNNLTKMGAHARFNDAGNALATKRRLIKEKMIELKVANAIDI